MKLSHLCYLAALLFVFGVLLTGCSTVQPVLEERGRQALDAKVQASNFALRASRAEMCRVASVGAVVDEFGTAAELWAAWCTLCGHPAGLCRVVRPIPEVGP